MREIDRFIELNGRIYDDPTQTPRLVLRAKAVQRVLNDEPLNEVCDDTGLGRHFLRVWVDAVEKDGFYSWLGKPEPKVEKILRSRGSIAQMLLGSLAEEHFEALAHDALGQQGFHIADDRVGRTDTDYRLFDANEHPVCRFNIKFHGTLFRESREYVDLDPADCFALATYKIDKLFERVHALRLRGFNRTFRGAEINMHLSLSSEMMAFPDFLQILAQTGVQGLSVRLERGEI